MNAYADDGIRIERDVMNVVPFLEYLESLPDVSRSVVYRANLIDLLDEYVTSRRSSPQFSNWWSWVPDRDEACHIICHRLRELDVVGGDGSPPSPYVWIFSSIHRIVQQRNKGLIIKAPLRYHEAINYDVVMYTKYAFSNLTKRQPYFISKLESELRFRLPNYIDADAYIRTLVQQMERHPELELVPDRQGQMILRLRSNVHAKPPIPYQTAAMECLKEALDRLQREETYPIAHIIEQARGSRLEGCAQDAYISRVIEKLQRDGRLQFIEAPIFDHSYFTFARRGAPPPAFDSLLPTPAAQQGILAPPPILPPAAPIVHPGESAIEKFTAAALKSLEKVPFFAGAYIRGESKKLQIPQGWSHDDFFTYIITGMQQDLRLTYSDSKSGLGQFALTGHVPVEEAVVKLTRRAMQLFDSGLPFTMAAIYAQASNAHPPNWPLDDYVQAIVDLLRQNPAIVYNPATRELVRGQVPNGPPVVPPPARDNISSSTQRGGLEERLPKKPLAVKLAIEEFTKLALDLLQFVPIFAVSFLSEETKKCMPPQWEHDTYFQSILQGMKQSKLLKYDQDEKGRGYFHLGSNAPTTPSREEPPLKKVKRPLPTINPAMDWKEPRLIVFPKEVTPRSIDLETEDSKLQAKRKAQFEAGTPIDNVEEPRRAFKPPHKIPLDSIAMD